MPTDTPFQHPLAYLRHQRGWSLHDVAELVRERSGLNMASWRQKVHRWERRGVVPEPAAQLTLAGALGVDPALVVTLGWPDWLSAASGPVEPVDGDWTPAGARAVLGRVVESAGMDRRGFFILGGGALAAAFLHAPGPIASGLDGETVGVETIEHLHTRTAELWHLDDALGGGACLPAAHADLQVVSALLRRARYSSGTERRLLDAASAVGRFAGWAAFDAGHHAAAQRYWHAALRCSHAAGNSGESAYVLSNLALQAVYTGAGRDALDLLDGARAAAGTASATVSAMLDTWAARAHALLGDHRRAELVLHRADETYDRRDTGKDPDWAYWMPQPSRTAEAGTAMLHDPRRAERMLVDGLADLGEDSARDTVLYLARISEAQLADGRLDEAASTAGRAVDAAAGIDSARVRDRLTGLLDLFPAGEAVTAGLRGRYARLAAD